MASKIIFTVTNNTMDIQRTGLILKTRFSQHPGEVVMIMLAAILPDQDEHILYHRFRVA